VPIADVDNRGSPGWWLARLFAGLQDKRRRDRLKDLHLRYHGRPPLPEAADAAREIFYAFQKKARTNFAELIVSAVSERMTVAGFRADGDDGVGEGGDTAAGELWERAGLNVISSDCHDLFLNASEAFVVIGEVDPDIDAPVVTVEDPRQMIAATDPVNPRRLIAALKVLHDPVVEQDQAYLYLPGRYFGEGQPAQIRVATRPAKISGLDALPFSAAGWSWDAGLSGQLAHARMPVVRFVNKDQVGEYEKHTDLLDRINHQTLQRMVIATMQAFRQRAVMGLPVEDEDGTEIDYSGVFTMDPAALWQLPETAKMWESGQVDLTPILSAVKDDVTQLAAVTRTPMHMLLPAGVNQSAEGANLAREGLVFKTKDRIERTRTPWAQVMGLCMLQYQGADVDLGRIHTMFASPERLSFAERADAASKAQNDVPRRSRLIHIWQFTPGEADRMMSEWEEEQLAAAAAAAAAAADNGQQLTFTQPAQLPAVDDLQIAGIDTAVDLGTQPVPTEAA
jgi:SPP1 Gp6-like portal protein